MCVITQKYIPGNQCNPTSCHCSLLLLSIGLGPLLMTNPWLQSSKFRLKLVRKCYQREDSEQNYNAPMDCGKPASCHFPRATRVLKWPSEANTAQALYTNTVREWLSSSVSDYSKTAVWQKPTVRSLWLNSSNNNVWPQSYTIVLFSN